MKLLTIRQPWAHAIMHLGKSIENRSRKDGRMPPLCKYRGELWIHAACLWSLRDFRDARQFMVDRGLAPLSYPLRPAAEHHMGAVIGRVDVVGHLEPASVNTWSKTWSYVGPDEHRPDSTGLRWWTGDHGLVFANPRALAEPVPYRKGQQGRIWTAPDELAAQLLE